MFFGCRYFVLHFILILCHLEVTGYEDRISLLYDYIIVGFKYYSIKFINDYIMLELMYHRNNSFIRVSVITNAKRLEIGMFFRKSKGRYRDRILLPTVRPLFSCSSGFRFVFIMLILLTCGDTESNPGTRRRDSCYNFLIWHWNLNIMTPTILKR